MQITHATPSQIKQLPCPSTQLVLILMDGHGTTRAEVEGNIVDDSGAVLGDSAEGVIVAEAFEEAAVTGGIVTEN